MIHSVSIDHAGGTLDLTYTEPITDADQAVLTESVGLARTLALMARGGVLPTYELTIRWTLVPL